MAPQQWAHLRDNAPSSTLSSTGASAASSSGESTSTTAAAAAAASARSDGVAPRGPIAMPSSKPLACPPEAGLSPGSLEGESKMEVARQLEAKLALEDS